jgi:uncharacterized membrane-anchored protein
MLGYRLETDFDVGKEQRRDRLWWCLIGSLCLLGVLFLIHPFSRLVFVGYSLTVLSYGDSFYVRRRDKIQKRWFWKSVLATVPLHLIFLGAIGWLTWAGPGFVRSAFSTIGFVVICFGSESVLFDSIADRFERAAS